MATHSSTPAWEIAWTGESGGLQSTGSQRVRTELATCLPEGELAALPGTSSFAKGSWFRVGGVLGILPRLLIAFRGSM